MGALTIGRLRLWSGLVLFVFAFLHFLNHALGLVDVTTMEAVEAVRRAVWRTPPGTVLLYGSFAIHTALGLWRVIRLRSWRLPVSDALQIALGLAIPFLLANHIIRTRGAHVLFGVDDVYSHVLHGLWPGGAVRQSLLLLCVWVHGTIGLHHWLNGKPLYERARPWLLGFAVLLPALALAGWIEAARRLAEHPEAVRALTEAQQVAIRDLSGKSELGVLAIGAAALLASVGIRLAGRLRGGIVIQYPGYGAVRVRPGATLLEISRAQGVPHVSVCGGRGRCTTCRVYIAEGAESLPEPSETEAAALARIEAPADVRLACQIRPTADMTVRRLVPAVGAQRPDLADDPYRWGVERRVTVMFADIRDFTTVAERLYPYDSVFLLNRYFDAMADAIVSNGGIIDKFLGDGVMALFGVAKGRGAGQRDALMAARAMQQALADLNEELRTTVGEPLRMGIGLNTGPAVLGRIGASVAATESWGLTALGDTVNTASRLESLTKEFGVLAVVAGATLTGSGLALPGAETREIAIRGRTKPILVHLVQDLAALRDASGAGLKV